MCGCPHGQERFGGSCEALFAQGVCGDGQVLLPDNFHNRQKICPSNFSCKRSDNCRGFQKMKAELSPRGSMERKEQVAFLEYMICHKKSRSVCCPEHDRESLFSPATLLASMVTPQAVCVHNPCTGGSWPWVGEDGTAKCLQRGKGVEHCRGELVEEDGRIGCRFWDLKSLAPIFGKNCGRIRRWIYGRCVRIF